VPDGVAVRRSDATAVRTSLVSPQAFAVVFERHFDAVYGYAQRRVGRDLAEEIASETFTRAFDRRDKYDLNRDDARPWLLGIATNLLRRHWRSEQRRLLAYGRAAAESQPALYPPTPVATEIVEGLGELSARDREALLLFAWADLTYEDIAVALEVPVGTVRSRIARARRLLRDRLGSTSPLPAPVRDVPAPCTTKEYHDA
jgi:RNA polymerase sigma factor (sigma-70 family)